MVTLAAVPKHWPKVLGVLSPPVISYPHGIEAGMSENQETLLNHPPVRGKSFPSGHAANNLCVATVLIMFYPRRGWLYLPVALSIAYARIYTGAHWPLDVLVGMLLGIGCGWLAVQVACSLWKRFGERVAPALAASHPNLLA